MLTILTKYMIRNSCNDASVYVRLGHASYLGKHSELDSSQEQPAVQEKAGKFLCDRLYLVRQSPFPPHPEVPAPQTQRRTNILKALSFAYVDVTLLPAPIC